MAEITIEKALMWRDTFEQPTVIINNILCNEGMELYEDKAIERIWELLENHEEYGNDYIVDFGNNCALQLTLPGFLLAKHVLLSYISEERYEKYLEYLRLKCDQIRSKNTIIHTLMNTPQKELKKMIKEAKYRNVEYGEEIISFMRAELKARRIRSLLARFIITRYLKIAKNIQTKIIMHRLSKNLKVSSLI